MLLSIVLLAGRFSGRPVGLIFAMVAFLGYLFDAQLYISAAVLIAVVCTFFSWRRHGMSINHHARQWSTLMLNLAIAGVGFLLYELGRIATNGGERMAYANSEREIALQSTLRFPHESAVQQWLLEHDLLSRLVNRTYSFLFLSTVIGVLVWLYLNNFPVYRRVRNAIGLATLVSIGVSALFPMAPPPLMPESGVIDSHARVGSYHGFVNQFAAMPSLHIGWLAAVGWGYGPA